MNIRPATSDDADVITSLRMEMMKEFGRTVHLNKAELAGFHMHNIAYYRKALENGSYMGWVAENQKGIMGMGGVSAVNLIPHEDDPSGVTWFVCNIYTIPAFREQGICQNIMAEILNLAKDWRICKLWLYATEQGKPLYSKFGFEQYEKYMQLRLEYDDE